MRLSLIKRALIGTNLVKKIYHGSCLVYSWIHVLPNVSEETVSNVADVNAYEEGSTTWGNFTLSNGCFVSEDGLEIQNDETYMSTTIAPISYPLTLEFKCRLDPECYRRQDSNPGMLFGIGPTKDGWGDGITCFSTTDYGIIIDTIGAMTITTYKTPEYCHIVLVVDSSGFLTLYMNGTNNSWTTSNTNSAIKSEKTYIYNGQGLGRFVGAISCLRIWSNKLSINEIETLFQDDDSKYSL